jgi:hypothetical protein
MVYYRSCKVQHRAATPMLHVPRSIVEVSKASAMPMLSILEGINVEKEGSRIGFCMSSFVYACACISRATVVRYRETGPIVVKRPAVCGASAASDLRSARRHATSNPANPARHLPSTPAPALHRSCIRSRLHLPFPLSLSTFTSPRSLTIPHLTPLTCPPTNSHPKPP